MKERVREAVFNLVGPAVKGKLVIDLFSGTGAMGLEALSRGAGRAMLVERRFPAVRMIEQNVEQLGLQEQAIVVPGDAFVWGKRWDPDRPDPWLVFCCPPYEFFIARAGDMLSLCQEMIERAPLGSLVVVESDARFDTQQLPRADQWDVRQYPPAVVSILDKTDMTVP